MPNLGSGDDSVGGMDFVVTETFYSTYESLTDDEVVPIDEAIQRLLTEHSTAWARQGRIEGDRGSAWILAVRTPSLEAALYWDYHDEANLVIVALVITPF
jgi:hypothetical protein